MKLTDFVEFLDTLGVKFVIDSGNRDTLYTVSKWQAEVYRYGFARQLKVPSFNLVIKQDVAGNNFMAVIYRGRPWYFLLDKTGEKFPKLRRYELTSVSEKSALDLDLEKGRIQAEKFKGSGI